MNSRIVRDGARQMLAAALQAEVAANTAAHVDVVDENGRLQGRTNATMRSLNRAAIVVGAPLGGLPADAVTARFALWVGVAGITVSAGALAASGFRHATLDDA